MAMRTAEKIATLQFRIKSTTSRYIFAFAAIAAAILLRYALMPALGMGFQYVTVFPAIVIVAVFAGRGPAMITSILAGTIATWSFSVAFGIPALTGLVLVIFTGFVAGTLAHNLRQSEEQFRAFFELAAVGTLLLDNQGRIVRANTRYCDMLGCSLHEIIGLTPTQFDHPDDRAADQALLKDFLHGRQNVYNYEKRFIRKDGREIWVQINAALISDTPNRFRTAAVVQDITDRKQAQSLQARLSAIVETSDDPIISHDLDGIITTWNAAAQRLYGYTAEEIIGKPITLLLPPDRVKDESMIRDHIRRGQRVEHFETVRVTKDGRYVDVWLTSSPLFDSTGKIVGVSKIVHDITERKRSERQLLELKNRLEEKNRELEAIIGLVSHDLRAPLVNVKGFTQEIKKDIESIRKNLNGAPDCRKIAENYDFKSIPESIDFIDASADTMSRLVESLVQAARAGLANLKPQLIDMNRLADEVLRNLEYKIKQKDVLVALGDLPACFADRVHAAQMLSNLIDNAIKYLDPRRPGTIQISGKALPGESVYCVEDNGLGIPEDKREKIFDIFYRIHTEAAKGEGIGLAMVKRIADRNNGRIWFESKSGLGSKFFIALPR